MPKPNPTIAEVHTGIAAETIYATPLRVTFHYDHDVDYRNDYDEPWELISFNMRHTGYVNPETILACQYETDDGYSCDEFHHGENGQHPYTPDPNIAAHLAYFEHGLCRWSRTGHGPADYGGFDTVQFAGVLIWSNGGDGHGHREYWETLTPDKQTEQIDGYLDEYTKWANGECYGFIIEAPAGECGECHRDNEPIDVESLWGMIGYECARDEALMSVAAALGKDKGELVEGTDYVIDETIKGY